MSAAWIAHPGVRELTQGLRPWADPLLAPYEESLGSPAAVAAFLASAFEPGDEERRRAARRFYGGVRRTANALRGLGVPLDPESPPAILALAQLVVLEIDREASPTRIAATLASSPGQLDG